MSRPTTPAEATASLYVRLSREAAETNLSRDGMLDDVRALAGRLGLRVVAEHVDDGLSGAIRDRPEFVGWLDDAREGRVSNLIAWHVDRMTREGVNVAALILDTIEGKDPETGRVVRDPVRLLDTKGLDSFGDETAFRFRFVIAAEVARAERERMRDRSRAAHRRAREAGRWAGGPPPFGFRVVDNPDGPGRVLEVVPEEADALHRVVALLAAGESMAECSRRMNTEGPRPRRAAHWSARTLTQCLLAAGTQAQILSPAERLVVSRYRKNPVPTRKGRAPAQLLSMLLRCASCGMVLRSGSDGVSRSYRCSSGAKGTVCPAKVSLQAPLAEAAIEALWLDGWGRLPETEVVRGIDEAADRLALVEEQIETAAASVVASRGPDRAEALAALETLEAQRDALEAEPVSTVAQIRETGRTYADAWRATDVPGRRALLQRTVGTLTIRPAFDRPGSRGFDTRRIVDLHRLDPGEIDAVEAL